MKNDWQIVQPIEGDKAEVTINGLNYKISHESAAITQTIMCVCDYLENIMYRLSSIEDRLKEMR